MIDVFSDVDQISNSVAGLTDNSSGRIFQGEGNFSTVGNARFLTVALWLENRIEQSGTHIERSATFLHDDPVLGLTIIKVLIAIEVRNKRESLNKELAIEFWTRVNYLSQIKDPARLQGLGRTATTRNDVYKKLILARNYIHANYQKSITLSDISENAMLSKFHLVRRFKEMFKLSPYRYLTELRLSHLCYSLVGRTSHSIRKTCLESGFDDYQNFMKLFCRYFDMTPGHFRTCLIGSA